VAAREARHHAHVPFFENERLHIDRMLHEQTPRRQLRRQRDRHAALASPALETHAHAFPARRATVAAAMDRAQTFVENRLFDGDSAYTGVVLDGRLLGHRVRAARTARERRSRPPTLASSIAFLLKYQNPTSGGFSHGVEFEHVPDYDNTAAVFMALRGSSEVRGPAVQHALKYNVHRAAQGRRLGVLAARPDRQSDPAPLHGRDGSHVRSVRRERPVRDGSRRSRGWAYLGIDRTSPPMKSASRGSSAPRKRPPARGSGGGA